MKFIVQYRAWGKVLTEVVEANSKEAARAEVHRTLFAPDAEVLEVAESLSELGSGAVKRMVSQQ